MDPNPIKHPAVLLARVRDAIEPLLVEAGFQFDRRNNPQDRAKSNLWIDYSRGRELLSLRWDRLKAALQLELINTAGEVHMVADVCLSGIRSTDELMARIDQFVQRIGQSLTLKRLLSE